MRTPRPRSLRLRALRTRRARAGVASAAALVGVSAFALGPAPAGALGVSGPPAVHPPVFCLYAYNCPRTTSITFSHPKDDEVDVYATWASGEVQPATEIFSVTCDDGFSVSKTATVAAFPGEQGMLIVPREAANPAVVTCTASQTIPPGYTTTPVYAYFTEPGYSWGYQWIDFQS